MLLPPPTPAQIRAIDSHKLIAAAGPPADCVQFVEYIQRNVALNEFRTNLKSSTNAVASYTRSQLATALRKNPYQVNLLLAGYDGEGADGTGAGPSLHYIDYLGSSQPMNFAAHGYASYFIFSTMDRHWRKGMNLEEALALVRMCIAELSTRFIMHQPVFKVKVADKDGVREVKL